MRHDPRSLGILDDLPFPALALRPCDDARAEIGQKTLTAHLAQRLHVAVREGRVHLAMQPDGRGRHPPEAQLEPRLSLNFIQEESEEVAGFALEAGPLEAEEADGLIEDFGPVGAGRGDECCWIGLLVAGFA